MHVFALPLYVLPAPSQVVLALFGDAQNLFMHGMVSLSEAIIGMGISLAASLVLGAARLLYRMKLIRGDGLLAALRCSNRLSRATMETWRRRRSPLSSRPGR